MAVSQGRLPHRWLRGCRRIPLLLRPRPHPTWRRRVFPVFLRRIPDPTRNPGNPLLARRVRTTRSRRSSFRRHPLRLRLGVLALLLAIGALAPGPPDCVPVPVEVGADWDARCFWPACEPGSEGCAVGFLVVAGTPCDEDGRACRAGRCVFPCVPRCEDGRVCGPDGCGGLCGDCGDDAFCSAGQCVPEGAGPGPNMEIVSTFPGEVTAIEVVGDIGLLGAKNMLFILDLSGDGQAGELGRLPLPDGPRQIAVQDGLAYLALHDEGLLIVDVSRPAVPTLVGVVGGAVGALGIALSGPLAYVATVRRGVVIYDVSDPARPRKVGRLPTPDWAMEVVVRGHLAYVAGRSAGLLIYDVSDLTDPRLVSEGLCGEGEETLRALVLDGDFLYCSCDRNELAVVDISSPASPRILSRLRPPLDTWAANRMVARDGTLYVAGQWGVGILVVDVSAPESPVFVGDGRSACHERSYYCYGDDIAMGSDRVLLAYQGHGLLAFPQAPFDAGLEPTPTFRTAGRVLSVSADGERLVVTSVRPGISLIDIAETSSRTASPEHPEAIGAYADFSALFVSEGTLLGDLLLAVGWYGTDLRAVTVRNPTSPGLVGELRLPVPMDARHDALAAGGGLVVYAHSRAIHIIDVLETGQLEYVTTVTFDGRVRGSVIVPPFVYSAIQTETFDTTLFATDLSRPAEPVTTAVQEVGGTVSQMTASGSRVFLLSGEEGLLVLAAAGNDEMVRLGSSNPWVEGTTFFTDLRVAGPFAYVLYSNSSLEPEPHQRVDVLDWRGAAPTRLGGTGWEWGFPFAHKAVSALFGRYLVIPASDNGLVIVGPEPP